MLTRRKARRLRIAANRNRRALRGRRRAALAVRVERLKRRHRPRYNRLGELERPMYYDRKGQPIWDTLEWCDLVGDLEYKIVARDYLPVPGVPPDEAFVSTVWLGIDHSFGEGPPLIFETMVFVGTVELHAFGRAKRYLRDVGDIQLRYSTEAEALEGHAAVLARCLEFIHLTGRLLQPGAADEIEIVGELSPPHDDDSDQRDDADDEREQEQLDDDDPVHVTNDPT